MPDPKEVSAHYTLGSLLSAIQAGIAKLGKSPDSVTVDDLAPVDEFHIGGRQASHDLLEQLNPGADDHVLDVGCGLGGASRFVARRYGSRVTGIDLTPEYVEAGNVLCAWVGLNDRIELHQGNALSMPFQESAFDGSYMFHAGMNIEDKAGLCSEVSRVLRPGAWFAIYDVMPLPVPKKATFLCERLTTRSNRGLAERSVLCRPLAWQGGRRSATVSAKTGRSHNVWGASSWRTLSNSHRSPRESLTAVSTCWSCCSEMCPRALGPSSRAFDMVKICSHFT